MSERLACVDIGSTWTEAALVEPPAGRLMETRQAPTTPSDAVAGVLAATEGWGAPVRACSSAGGGVRGFTRRDWRRAPSPRGRSTIG